MGNRPFDQPAANPHFQLALTLTAVNGHSEIASMLLAAGSRIDATDATDNDGNSSLDLAIAYGEPKCSMVLEIIELEALVPKASLATPETQCPLGARLRLSSRPRRAIPRKTALHATPQPRGEARGSKTLTTSFTHPHLSHATLRAATPAL